MSSNGFKVIDSDMHVMEPPDLWERYLDPEFRPYAPRGRTSENVRDLGLIFPRDEVVDPVGPQSERAIAANGHNYEHNQELYADHSRRGWTTDCQLEAMELEGLDAAVLFPSRGLHALEHPYRQPQFASAIARAYNDWMFDFCAPDTTKLIGAGMISVFDIDDAVRECRRVVDELGFKAVFIRANVINGTNWHDPYYEPLWDVLEELNIPVGFHEALQGGVRRSAEHYMPSLGLRRIYGQPFENMLAMGSFLCGGILEHHPALKVAFLEANCSWAPWLLWRMDEHYELEGDIFMPELTMRPSEYFMRQCYVSVEPDEDPVRHMIEDFGAERLVFSTDYPHGDSRYPNSVSTFLKLPLSETEKRKILWDNCANFYSVE
jgi:predicted TIM-barrel fold metal-dependent hydrolase